MSRQAGMLSGPTTPRHGMQSLLASPWCCDSLARIFKDKVRVHSESTLHTIRRFICGCQAGAGSWAHAAVTCNATMGHDGRFPAPGGPGCEASGLATTTAVTAAGCHCTAVTAAGCHSGCGAHWQGVGHWRASESTHKPPGPSTWSLLVHARQTPEASSEWQLAAARVAVSDRPRLAGIRCAPVGPCVGSPGRSCAAGK
jgi:hypothetical protein